MKTEGLSFPEVVERLASEAGVAMPKPERSDGREAERADARTRLLRARRGGGRVVRGKAQGARRPGGAPLPGAARAAARDHRRIPPRVCAGEPVGAEGTSGAQRLHAAGDGRVGHADRGRGHPRALRPLPQPRDVSDPRPQGPRHRLRRTRARSRCAGQVSELAGDAALSQGRRAVQRRRARQAGATSAAASSSSKATWTSSRCAEAGFGETVAPLGTALTDGQLQLLWRMAPEPILCFDGDSAGRKAAFRAVDTALPAAQGRHEPGVRFPARRARSRTTSSARQGREALSAVLDAGPAAGGHPVGAGMGGGSMDDAGAPRRAGAAAVRPDRSHRRCRGQDPLPARYAHAPGCRLAGGSGAAPADRKRRAVEPTPRQSAGAIRAQAFNAREGPRESGPTGPSRRPASSRDRRWGPSAQPQIQPSRGRGPGGAARTGRPCCCGRSSTIPGSSTSMPRPIAALTLDLQGARNACATRCFRCM